MFCIGLASADAKYTADFLTLGVGARVLGMGGAGTALSADAYAPYWNSAGLGATYPIRGQFHAFHTQRGRCLRFRQLHTPS